MQIDTAVKRSKHADWRGHQARENVIKTEIYPLLSKSLDTETNNVVREPQAIYSQNKMLSEVERIFEIIKEQSEY
ncbi:MAG TPA: hypothetical protein EYP59_12050 [Thiotrichaceae bacterium]|nr:hypothetical protein [Thiotrichaceae bacterium]